MLALKILDTKEFMNLLLRSTIFDSFLLYEATVKTSVTYEINGRYQKDFFDSLEDDLKPKEDFTWWESQKPHIFQWMKGKRTPLFFKISLLLSKENLNHFLLDTLICHRGIYDNKDIYENTIDAFKETLKYDCILEFDVRMLKCGTLVVFHDDDMERLLHVEGKIEKITYDELTYMAKYEVPTFESVLKLINGKIPILIETKSKTKRCIMESKMAELLDKYNGLYAIQSFNLKSLKWFNKNRENVVIGYLIGKKNCKSEPIFFKKYDFLNVNIKLFNDKRVRKMREDKKVLGYTVKTKEMYELKKDVYDNLSCDNLLEIIEG